MAESVAENYFKKYTGANAATILSGLPSSQPKTFEDNWLDFKSGKTQPQDLEGIWSKAIGAMGNAGGGVVIFGIYAAKHGTPPVDAAERLELVPDINALKSRLIEISHFATDPPLPNVRIEAIPVGTMDGFLVCLIPEGSHKPYMSLKAKRPFYLRIGDESKEPPLPILRQLFNPTIRNNATLTVQIGTNSQLEVIGFTLYIVNQGPNSIEHGALRINTDTAHIAKDGLFRPQGKVIKLALTDTYFHPGFNDIQSFYAQAPTGRHEFRVTLYQRNHAPQVVTFGYNARTNSLLKDGKPQQGMLIELPFIEIT